MKIRLYPYFMFLYIVKLDFPSCLYMHTHIPPELYSSDLETILVFETNYVIETNELYCSGKRNAYFFPEMLDICLAEVSIYSLNVKSSNNLDSDHS